MKEGNYISLRAGVFLRTIFLAAWLGSINYRSCTYFHTICNCSGI